MKNKAMEDFGKRLLKLRKGQGLTQVELGKIVGVSDRVIAYYENESSQPPGPIIVDLAQALKVTVDELLGVKPIKENTDPKTARVLKRLKRVTELPPVDQRAVMKFIDALVEQNQSKQQHQTT